VTLTPAVTSYDVKAWQSFSPVRSRMVSRIEEIKTVLLQTGGINTELYYGGGSWSGTPTRTVTDGVLNGTTTVTSATATFVTGDVGASLVGAGIPAGAVIASRTNATSVVISAAATLSATGVTLAIGAAGTSKFTPPTPGVDDQRMLGLEFIDGAITKRYIYPTAQVLNVGPVNYQAGKEATYDVTFRVLGDAWFELSNDPADQSGTLAA
jgi:hypothetical protein